VIAVEMPISQTVGRSIGGSFKARFIAIPVTAVIAALQYQAADSAIYYLIGLSFYIYSYYQGEVYSTMPLYL
jgi:hypothetical protein